MPSPRRKRTALPLLFGQSLRTQVLVALAVTGRAIGAEITRVVGATDRGPVYTHLRRLVADGIVRHNADATFELRSWFASEELHALLRKVASKNAGAAPPNSNFVPPAIGALFGGRPRTEILAALAALGPIQSNDLARLAGVRDGTVRHALEHLRGEGVVTSRREPPYVFVLLNEDFSANRQLHALALRIAEHLYDVAALRQRQIEIDAARRSQLARSDLPTDMERYVPFGDATQRKMLLEIARRDVVSRPRLAALLQTSPDSVKGVLESLLRHQLVTTTTVGSGPQRRMWVALDPRHPLTEALRDLAQTLTGKIMVETDTRRPPDFPRVGAPYARGDIPACLPGEELPNHVMLTLNRGEPVDERVIRGITGLYRPRIREILAQFVGRGLVKLIPVKGRLQAQIVRDEPWSEPVLRLTRDAERFIREHYGGMSPRHRCMHRLE